jgi:hypothetical protein
MLKSGDKAILYVRGSGSLQERRLASGTVKGMLDRFFSEPPSSQRELVMVANDLEYRPAEIVGLATRLMAEADEAKSIAAQSRLAAASKR